MASEQQRRAFAEYMGSTATAANPSDQQVQQGQQQQAGLQNPGWYAGLQNAVGQQGLQGYQGLQNPYAGPQYAGFNPVRYLPAPLGYAFGQGPPAAQLPPAVPPGALATSQQLAQLGPSMPPPPRPPGYVDLPRSYQAQGQQQQPGADYNVGWQYNNPMAPNNTTRGPLERTRDHYRSSHYTGVWPPPDVVRAPSPPRAPPPEPQVHVLLCHVCSVCGRMRSAGFHRHHPVIPGHPHVQSPCRRCKKKAKKEREKRAAQESRDSGDRTIRIEIAGGEPRGRARSREGVVYVSRRHSSPSPRRTHVRSSSRARLGVRVLRQEQSPPPALRRRTRTELRVSSSSPPVDVRFRRHRSDEVYSTRDRYDAHLPTRRVTELSPSPPPARTRTTTRVEHRHESPEPRRTEYRRHSPSPVRVDRRERRSEDAQSRLAAHPSAYRTVVPDYRTYLRESEDSVSTESRQPSPPPLRGILRNSEMDHRTTLRRRMEASHDSMLPESGGSRVQFGGTPRRVERHVVDYTREHTRRRDPQRGYSEEVPPPPPSPPLERSFGRLRVRESTPPPSREYEDEVRVRHISPRRYEEVRVRRNSPAPRGRTQTQREPSPGATSYTRYLSIERTRSVSPPPDPRHEDWEDVTESESEHSGELVSVRRYRDLDENGRPATFVEERRTRYVGAGAPTPLERTFPTTPAITRGFQPV